MQERLDGRRKSIQKGYSRYSFDGDSAKEKERFKYYGRLNLTGKDAFTVGRLKYTGQIRREKMTREDYDELLRRQGKRSFKRRTKGRLLFHGVKSVVDEEGLAEDELTSGMKRGFRRTGRLAYIRPQEHPFAKEEYKCLCPA